MKRVLSLLAAAALLLPAAYAAPAQFQVDAASAVLMEKETGEILYESNADQPLEPASVTKVMTMLLVMEALDEGRITREDTVTASACAAGMGGSQVYLKEGEQMSVGELLKCVAVASANDAAVALAEHLAGSEEAFVQRMNQRAGQLGMKNTNFINCTGLPADGHYTSALDIALMSRQLILYHPDIREYTTIWMDSIRDGTFGLSNTNRLIRFYDGATGLKTGFTDTALYCMSATAQRGDMELIAVVMKSATSDDRFQAAKQLLDYGFANFTLTTVYPDAALAPVDVLLGQSGQVQPVPERECRLLVERGSLDGIATQITLAQDVAAPVEAGQKLGVMTVTVDGVIRDEVPLVAAEGVERLSLGGIFSRMLQGLLMRSA